jgi:Fic family protein
MKVYIHQKSDWPQLFWNSEALLMPLSEVRNLQGRLFGKMDALGFQLKSEALLNTLSLDVLKSTEIEGEYLDPNQVRSSLARKLGIEIAGSVESDRNVDGMVEMMLDATQNCNAPLTPERLFDWHAALFPTGRSGIYPIAVVKWREDTTGPMQVISGALGKEKVHFEAPASHLLPLEMNRFLDWFNNKNDIDLVIKAAVAHFWFVTIHPFDDGNGRITRALTDMVLAQSDKSTDRFYSMSAQIRIERKLYYEILEKSQKGDLDITPWLLWFLECLRGALHATEQLLKKVLFKGDFWQKNAEVSLNERQKKLLNKYLDGFDGKLTSSKWAKISKCSKDTAIRDIADLIDKGILKKETSGGRSTNYELA